MPTIVELWESHKPIIAECGEPMVNLGDYDAEIVVRMEETSRLAQGLAPGECRLRKGAAERLHLAQQSLPKGYRLKILDGYRPLSAQKAIYSQYFNEFKKAHPGATDREAEDETDKWVANPEKMVPPHSTGGVLDLTIQYAEGNELDMGSGINTTGQSSHTDAGEIGPRQRENRNLLISAMTGAGFANYEMEWWHWSYGDWVWGIKYGKTSFYGPL
ncbi:MAG: M15 family metallopeptidase [Candidatus Marsarchaeota archaeon]|nr:M15 family metallopeptidase [Candidatus Marsarchaeota archaeon]MCL5413431.1 M15 family metallopeptidase [Candidatus Marsarchaeota archaeon]